MNEKNPYELSDSLFQFAIVPKFEEYVIYLAENLAQKEDWDYHNVQTDLKYPILQNYIKYTYRRIAEEKKIAVSEDEEYACLNTGLITPNQEPIFLLFEKNKFPEHHAYWHFCKFVRKGEWELSKFTSLPAMAHYFSDPTCLIFDSRKELRKNLEHIIEDTKERFPEDIRKMNNYGVQNILKGAIDSAIERVKRNYKTAIPQYYNGSVQLLLPICLTDPLKADLALVIERFHEFYRATTCLTLDMAYNNARQLAKPDRDWLQP